MSIKYKITFISFIFIFSFSQFFSYNFSPPMPAKIGDYIYKGNGSKTEKSFYDGFVANSTISSMIFSSDFGPRVKSTGSAIHQGLDIISVGTPGYPLLAVERGRIVRIRPQGQNNSESTANIWELCLRPVPNSFSDETEYERNRFTFLCVSAAIPEEK